MQTAVEEWDPIRLDDTRVGRCTSDGPVAEERRGLRRWDTRRRDVIRPRMPC